jgi:hypothetical protein
MAANAGKGKHFTISSDVECSPFPAFAAHAAFSAQVHYNRRFVPE